MICFSIQVYPHSPSHNGLLMKVFTGTVRVCYWWKQLSLQYFPRGGGVWKFISKALRMFMLLELTIQIPEINSKKIVIRWPEKNSNGHHCTTSQIDLNVFTSRNTKLWCVVNEPHHGVRSTRRCSRAVRDFSTAHPLWSHFY